MALSAQEVALLQNREPTDWGKLDMQLMSLSSFNANRFAQDHILNVEFFNGPVMNVEQTLLANRPIYEDKDCIRIRIPGDKLNIIDRVIDPIDLQRFPKQWERFQRGVSQLEGIPLSQAPFMTPALVKEYQFFNIETVEQLANTADGLGQQFRGFHDHKRLARTMLEQRGSIDALRDEKDLQIAAMQADMAEMRKMIEKAYGPQSVAEGEAKEAASLTAAPKGENKAQSTIKK